jgi:oligopeptide transport system permease protein
MKAAAHPVSHSPWRAARRRLAQHRGSQAAVLILGLLLLYAVVAPLVSPWAYDDIDWRNFRTPPSLAEHHPFGTDSSGRDLFVRTALGLAISLALGILATLVSVAIGLMWGGVAGLASGRTDSLMMRIVDILYALPFMFIVILLMVVFGRNIVLIFIGVGLVEWLTMARIVRGQTLSLKRKEFVEAARALGAPGSRILARHILPNLLGIVAVYATLTVPVVILVESFLSFLGLGVQEPLTSLGVLIKEGAEEVETGYWILLIPGAVLSLLLLSLNLLGDGLRDALDPKDR